MKEPPKCASPANFLMVDVNLSSLACGMLFYIFHLYYFISNLFICVNKLT